MSLKTFIKCCLLLSFLLCSLVSCDMPSVSVASPTNTTPIVSQHQLNVWYPASTGVEVRYEDWKSPGNNEDTMTIVRFDLRHIKLSVAYQPSHPLPLSQWMQKEHAVALMNGGYFDTQDQATGLVVANGQTFGSSYTSFGGMLSVNAQGHISLRSLRQQPYDPNNEQLQQATQSSPMLVIGGKRTQFNADAGGQRRSIVATDKQGRLLLIISPGNAFSLDEMADLLVSSDLSINNALNLDGGASTGLYVNGSSQQVAIDSFANLPLVLIVQTR